MEKIMTRQERKEQQREYYEKRKGEILKHQKEYRATHKEEIYKRDNRKRRHMREEMLDGYGAMCEFCGETTREWLELDHINKHPEKNENGKRIPWRRFYQELKEAGWPRQKYRLLCSNCNMCRERHGDETARERGLQKKKERIRALQRELFSELYEYPDEQVKEI